MLHLHWQKTLGRLIILTLISVSASLHAAAQKVLYLEDHDSKPYYCGIIYWTGKEYIWIHQGE